MFVYIFCFKMWATFSNFCETFCSTEWFQQQQQFTNEIENMEVDELKKCLAKFYVAVRKADGSYYKKTSLLSIRAALDRHLKAPPNNKKFSICDNMFSHFFRIIIDAIILKQLVTSGDLLLIKGINDVGATLYNHFRC